MAITLEGLGYVALAQNRLRLAELHLKTALRFYTEIEDLDGVAYTHLYLGHWSMAQGMFSDAATHYRAMIGARQKLGHTHLLNQGWAGLADVAWRRGELHEAMAFVERCWPAVLAGPIQGEEPMPTYWTCYVVLSALGDDRATVVLDQALSLLHQQIGALGDDELARQTFMQSVSSHRALLAAAQGTQGIYAFVGVCVGRKADSLMKRPLLPPHANPYLRTTLGNSPTASPLTTASRNNV